jgi:hypothetical protein
MSGVLLMLIMTARAATLEGTVSSTANGAPVKKARITARASDATYTAISNASGQWSIAHLPDGEYDLAVECQGYLPRSSKRMRVRVPDDGAVAVELTPLAVISGRVLDDDGDPLPHVTLFALSYDYSRVAPVLHAITKAVSDDRGEYRLFDLKPGRYYVQAVFSERGYKVLFHPGVAEAGEASPYDLGPAADVTGIDFRMGKSALFGIRGRVTDAKTGEPFRAVVVAEVPGSLSPRYTAPAQDDGGFAFPRVLPGSYRLSATQNSGQREMFAERIVNVTGSDVQDVELVASPAVDVKGTVTSDGGSLPPALNLRVTLRLTERTGFSASAVPKADGSFSIQAAPQPLSVEVEGIPPELYLREIRIGAEDASGGRVDLRRDRGPLTLALARNPGRISGAVQLANGKAASEALVAITPADPANRRYDLTRTVMTETDGSFAAGSLAPGEYLVFAWEQNDTALAGSTELRRLLAGRSTAVTVRSGGEESVRLRTMPQADVDAARRRIR